MRSFRFVALVSVAKGFLQLRMLPCRQRNQVYYSLAEKKEDISLEDRNVPEEHRGLHDALYGDGEDHGGNLKLQALKREDGSATHDIVEWVKDINRKVCGVYLVRNSKNVPQYVGYSRDIAKALRAHQRDHGSERAKSVRVVEKNSLSRRNELEAMRDKVLAALSETPIGNLDGDWVESSAEALDRLEDDDSARNEYEKKKSKLQAAMAVSTASSSSSSSDLQKAVDSNDWSAVIDAQNKDENIISPFAGKNMIQENKDTSNIIEFSLKTVDAALNTVRPMLQADGGNVRVLAVNPTDKSVTLELEGACGACPSSTTTMKNGIEKALKNVWPDLGPVHRSSSELLTAAAAQALLDPIREAYTQLGATATVLNANLLGPGVVELEFSGPSNVRYGIELSLLASPLVSEVRWLIADEN